MNIIDKAADRLRGRWTKGASQDGRGNVCIYGAIGAVDTGLSTADFSLLEQAIHDAFCPGATLLTIVNFNDDPATTEEDVLLLLKKASALYDERTGQSS